MREFVTAARDKFTPEPGKPIKFKHDDTTVTFFEPQPGQLAVMMGFGRGNVTPQQSSTFLALFFSLMDAETQRYIEDRLMDTTDPFDLDSKGGIFDLWAGLVEEWSGNPTRKSSGSARSPRATGRASTAPTRAKASTSSTSRSRASSR